MTLVSIIGDFDSSILPLFYEFKDRIIKHVIVYDDFKNDVKHARRIIEGTTKFIKKHNLPIKSYAIKMDEDSLTAVDKVAEFLKNYVDSEEELYINITDGLANVGVLLSNIFLPLGSKIVTYDRYDNEYNLLTKDEMQTCKIETSIPIQEHFLLKDIDIVDVSDKNFALNHKELIITLFEERNDEFKDFANEIMQQNPNVYKFNEIIDFLGPLGLNHSNLRENQMFITGGLFEYYIFLKLYELDYDDIEIGVKVKQYYNETNFIPNEFDLFIMKNNHLHMIECKYQKRPKFEELVYKYMALKNLIDEDSKIMIVTSHHTYKPDLNEPNSLANLPHKRARENRMLLLGDPIKRKEKFPNEVKNFFGL